MSSECHLFQFCEGKCQRIWRNKSEVQPRDVEPSQLETFLRHQHYRGGRPRGHGHGGQGGHGGNDKDDDYDDTKVDLTGFAKAANKESLCSRVSKEPARDT